VKLTLNTDPVAGADSCVLAEPEYDLSGTDQHDLTAVDDAVMSHRSDLIGMLPELGL
jgi:hypothetical protein